ncbi:DUF2750 domain-containing protein [Thalassotalea aquiviva]|uniref:DUF2750 domain-containing protein n=1 Tax=Thalassotalea aquiviva TaxID=3242415 RepID=UPI00352B424E
MTIPDLASVELNDEQRFQVFMKALFEHQQAWILTDEHGAVMLNSEENEEDFVPFWPSAETAQLWASDEWSHCKAQSISLDDLKNKWLPGMEEDELSLIIYPATDLQGQIYYPWEFDDILAKKQNKLQRR